MKPSKRNRIQAAIKAAKRDVEKWKEAAGRFTPKTLPHKKCLENLAQAQERLAALSADLSGR